MVYFPAAILGAIYLFQVRLLLHSFEEPSQNRFAGERRSLLGGTISSFQSIGYQGPGDLQQADSFHIDMELTT